MLPCGSGIGGPKGARRDPPEVVMATVVGRVYERSTACVGFGNERFAFTA